MIENATSSSCPERDFPEFHSHGHHADSTAVASIFSRALGSTSRVTSTTAMAGNYLPHDLAIGGAKSLQVGEILVDVADVPGQPHDGAAAWHRLPLVLWRTVPECGFTA